MHGAVQGAGHFLEEKRRGFTMKHDGFRMNNGGFQVKNWVLPWKMVEHMVV